MLQIVQYQKTGEISIIEIPKPECIEGGILVENEYSLISAGTEKTSITNAQGSFIERAKKQPDQVKLVFDTIKKQGIASTIERIKSKLESYKSLGYSSAGRVIQSNTDAFSVGDRVACAGSGYAVHSEIVTVPKNLAVRLPENVDFKQACFTTLGSIALQGVRQADVRLGETVAVIGLGLLGQLTVQLLRSNGCRVIGLDINKDLFARSIENGCEATYISNFDNINQILAFSNGYGCDSIIITASTSSNEPLELALKIARKKGTIVIVGSIGMNVPRSPFYEKELNLKISCSYGPGRYDPLYEEYGIDYPYSYVRWTENRNMQAFVELISSGKINLNSLITHIFDINEGIKAYDIITGKIKENFLGVLIYYPKRENKEINFIKNPKVKEKISSIKIGFIGAGTFAQNYLIPNLRETEVNLLAVSTSTPINAKSAAEKFGFKYSTTDSDKIIENNEINAIFCATRHNSHSYYVIKSLINNKPIFVEKPLCVNINELLEIEKQYHISNSDIMVGFNRRFSKPFQDIFNNFKQRTEPLSILYRINAGSIPKTNWIYREEQGGGRIIGEVCHFIDCMIFLTQSLPINVYAISHSSKSNENNNRDNVAINIKFSDGSIGSIEYFSNGDPSFPKEYCEVFCESSIAIMDNFKKLEIVRNGKSKIYKYDGKKGHKEEVIAFIKSLKDGSPMPISFDELKAVTLTTFQIIESLETGQAVNIEI